MHIGGPKASEHIGLAPVPLPSRDTGAGDTGAISYRPAPSPAARAASLREAIARRAIAELLDGAVGPQRGMAHVDPPARDDAPDLLVDMLIADALLDAGVAPRHPRIARTVHRIVQRYPADQGEHTRRITGLADPAGDAADLAQAMLLLARLGERDRIAAHCAPPLAILLTYAEADGAIPAWALPDAPSPADVEAIARLVYALARWDARRFLGMVVAGAHWVADRQAPDGSWCPPPGGETLHSCWQALRLLGAVMPNHPAVARGARFLHDSRRADGGWGAGATTPLSTALAVLALVATRTALPEALPDEVRPLLAPGRSGWPASSLPRTMGSAGSAAHCGDQGSSVVTALFALKASEALAPRSPHR